ncbi:MAG: family 10 glycosylhydrolase [Bacteroidota bacterium]
MTRTILLFTLLLLSFANHSNAQTPKREFRGAWIATVANIDWPSRPGLPAVEQQQQFIHRLDQLKDLGCNAVIVQIRPVCDAFYDSKLEPWSHYLTGRQGEAPFPYYDPLVFMIEETHKRNMEFHAWFNPFRALMDSKKNNNPPSHVTRKHPDWVVNYGGQSIIDPGIPEARQYVIDVLTDVVKRYDIDAVHMDDYFYPYPVKGQAFGDSKTFAKYGHGSNLADWRRDNISVFVSLLNTTIKHVKPYMKLGISPFGIWRNTDKDPKGTPTKGGLTTYDDLFADVLQWMQKGWVDYMMPQLYWEHDHRIAPFEVLMPWWYGHCYQRHVYYGLAPFKMPTAKSGPWSNANELMWQMRDIRGACPNSGYCFFSASSFDKVKPNLTDSLHKFAKLPALVPPMTWIDSIPPAAPVVKITADGSNANLKWQVSNPSNEPLRFVVYRFANNEPINLERNDRIISIQQGNDFSDAGYRQHRQATYVVTALDRLWNESKPSNKVNP